MNTAAAPAFDDATPLTGSPLRRFFRAWPPLILFAIAWLAVMLLIALFAGSLAPYDYSAMDLKARLTPPVWREAGTWLLAKYMTILRVLQ